jgi:hypothetical protein
MSTHSGHSCAVVTARVLFKNFDCPVSIKFFTFLLAIWRKKGGKKN